MIHLCKLCYSKTNDKSVYTKYTINNVNIDEFDKIFNYYITTHNKKLIFIIMIVKLEYNLIIITQQI